MRRRVSSDTRIWTLFDVRNWTPFVMLMQLRQEAERPSAEGRSALFSRSR